MNFSNLTLDEIAVWCPVCVWAESSIADTSGKKKQGKRNDNENGAPENKQQICVRLYRTEITRNDSNQETEGFCSLSSFEAFNASGLWMHRTTEISI